MSKPDKRIPVYFGTDLEDVILRDRITVAAKSLGMTNSSFFRAAAVFALDEVLAFERSVKR